MLSSASICSVTRMVPSSAAIALPTRPLTISAVSTGASSRVSDRVTMAPMRLSAPKREKPMFACTAKTMPVKMPVTITINRDSTPTKCICLNRMRTRYGGSRPPRRERSRKPT